MLWRFPGTESQITIRYVAPRFFHHFFLKLYAAEKTKDNPSSLKTQEGSMVKLFLWKLLICTRSWIPLSDNLPMREKARARYVVIDFHGNFISDCILYRHLTDRSGRQLLRQLVHRQLAQCSHFWPQSRKKQWVFFSNYPFCWNLLFLHDRPRTGKINGFGGSNMYVLI